MSDLLQTLVSGLANGSLYALIALGYTMVYGILKFINFAHGDVFVVGAWISLTIATALGFAAAGAVVPIWATPLILICAMLTCGLLALIIERFAYRPLRGAPRLNVLITAIGVSLLLQNVGQLPFTFGTQPRAMPTLISAEEMFRIGGVPITLIDVIGLSTSVALMLALEFLVHRTRLGRAMRAVSFSFKNAALMGINVNAVITFTFVLGAMLAGAAGLLYSQKYPSLNSTAHVGWVLLGLKAFVSAVVGGIGNIRGAMAGGFLIGLLEQFGSRYISSELRDVYVFALLIVVLLVRPSGLFGSTAVEKV
jgi:branched-chain amino acid transport system permease protein